MKVSDIKKHFEIVNLALDVKNYEVLNIETRFFLNSGKSELIEIAELLNSKNYRQALYLMKKYNEDNDSAIQFPEETSSDKILNIEDMLKMSPIAKETIREFKQNSYTKEDLEAFAKNIEIPTSPEVNIAEESSVVKSFKDTADTENKKSLESNASTEINSELDEYKNIDGDTPLDEISKEVLSKNNLESNNQTKKKLSTYKTLKNKFGKKNSTNEKDNVSNPDKEIQNNKKEEKEISSEVVLYTPIPDLSQKYRELFVLYPPVKSSDVWLEDIALLINKLTTNSYSDQDIENIYKEYEHYVNRGDIAKASQYLLLLSITESTYPKFMLARELFKGKILQRDIKKSFELMSKLAAEGHGNAICDLGQFYEYGIMVPENKNKALKLYEKSFELGIDRAINHINRIKENSGIIKKLFK